MARSKAKPGARSPVPAPREASQATGLYWPCPANEALHPRMPLAIPLYKGPKSVHFNCGACRSRGFLAPGVWKPNMGLTAQQALQRGLTIL